MASKAPARSLQDGFVAEFLRNVQGGLDEIDPRDVDGVVEALVACHRRGNTVYLAGNGGSAATASHFGSDLHAAARGRRRLKVSVLTDSVPIMTATANDHGWDNVFADPLAGRIGDGDVLVVLSASGDSESIVRALDCARDAGATSVLLGGFGGGRAVHLADCHVVVSSRDYGIVESVHATLAHLIAACFRRHVAV